MGKHPNYLPSIYQDSIILCYKMFTLIPHKCQSSLVCCARRSWAKSLETCPYEVFEYLCVPWTPRLSRANVSRANVSRANVSRANMSRVLYQLLSLSIPAYQKKQIWANFNMSTLTSLSEFPICQTPSPNIWYMCTCMSI